MNHLILDEWQEDIIKDESKYILLCKGRQIGGTSTFAEKAAQRLVNRKTSILVGSITEEQAKLVIVMVKDILERDNKKMIGKGSTKPTLDRIRLINGSEIRSRPVGTMGDAFKGFTADVNWFNEMSKWPEIAFVAIMPTLLTRGGEMWGDSTPFGKDTADRPNFFSRCFTNKDKRWKVYYKSSEDVIFNRPINEYWTEEIRANSIKFLEDQKKEMTVLQYGQEYLGLFLEDLQYFFEPELIEKVCVLKRPTEEMIPSILETGYRFSGHDLARMGGDQFTTEVLWKSSSGYTKKIKQIDSYAQKRLLTTRNEQLILENDKKWNNNQIGIDTEAGTLGVSVLDHLLETSIKKKVVAMNNRSQSMDKDDKSKIRLFQEDLYDNLKGMMERDEILLLDDDDIKLSLRSVQMELVKDVHGITKISIFGNFTHHVEGLTRAAFLANQKHSNISVSYI